jgi:hypothetical protein
MPNRHTDQSIDLHGGRLRVPRSRGALSGVVLVLLGAWGVLVPLIGPYVNFGYTPNKAWHLSAGRFWLEVLPGAAAFVGGLLLLLAADRISTVIGAWLAVAGGAWFVVGPTLRSLLHLGAIGGPIHKTTLGSTMETLLLFTGIGFLILLFGALAVGRLSVVSVRDVRAAQRRAYEAEAEPSQRTQTEPSGEEYATAAPANGPRPENATQPADAVATPSNTNGGVPLDQAPNAAPASGPAGAPGDPGTDELSRRDRAGT